MKKKFIWLLILTMPFAAQAQLGGLLKKAKDKITQRADSKVDKEMDKQLDEIEGKKTTGFFRQCYCCYTRKHG